MNRLRYPFLLLAGIFVCLLGVSCIEDGITTSPAAQPVFSTDTVRIGTTFTGDVSTTHRFTVHNRNDKGIIISDIHVSGPNAGLFRLNVDGMSGTSFQNIEIRAKDSIYVLVECTLPANGSDLPVDVESAIDFVTNGVTESVVISARGQDVERLRAVTIDTDTRFSATRPYQIFDSLVVAPGATLTLPAGATLYFHDKARMIVRGTLRSEGTPEANVTLRGDRTGEVINGVTFDLMASQWEGMYFTVSSRDNLLSHTCVRNTRYGVSVAGDGTPEDNPKLTLLNSRLRNSADRVLEVYDADITAIGCEFAEAANGVVYLCGGRHTFNHCTFANYYLFAAISGPLIYFDHLPSENIPEMIPTRADISNSILYGLAGTDVYPGEFKGAEVYIRRCLLKSAGTDDENFINCLWDKDPLYFTVRKDYHFDYRLQENSPAIGAADPSLTLPAAAFDAYGRPRGSQPDLGAYTFDASVKPSTGRP